MSATGAPQLLQKFTGLSVEFEVLVPGEGFYSHHSDVALPNLGVTVPALVPVTPRTPFAVVLTIA